MRRCWVPQYHYLKRAQRGTLRAQSTHSGQGFLRKPALKTQSPHAQQSLLGTWSGPDSGGVCSRKDYRSCSLLNSLAPRFSPQPPWGGRVHRIRRSPGSGVCRGAGSWKTEAMCSRGAWWRWPGGSNPLAVPERSHGRQGQAAPLLPIRVTHPPPHPALALCPASSHPGPPAKPGQAESAGSRPRVVGVAGPDF